MPTTSPALRTEFSNELSVAFICPFVAPGQIKPGGAILQLHQRAIAPRHGKREKATRATLFHYFTHFTLQKPSGLIVQAAGGGEGGRLVRKVRGGSILFLCWLDGSLRW